MVARQIIHKTKVAHSRPFWGEGSRELVFKQGPEIAF